MRHRLAATAAALTAIVLAPLGAATAAPAPTSTADRAATAVDATGTFVPLPGARILDTRSGVGASAPGRLGQQITSTLQVAGRGGVPAMGVEAVVLNVTGVDAVANTWVTVWPTGTTVPNASQLNVVGGETAANLVTLPRGADGKVNLYNGSGTLHLLADVVGYYAVAGGTVGGGFHPAAAPHRPYASRGTVQPWAAGAARRVPVGAPGMDASITAVSVSLTAQSTTSGWLTAWSGQGAMPPTSTVNYRRGWPASNHAIVPVTRDAQGQPWITVFASSGGTGVIADVLGWYDGQIDADGYRFTVTTPTRALDYREVGAGWSVPVPTAQVAPGAVAVVANVLGHYPSYPTWIGVSPTAGKPAASTVNVAPYQNRSNSTVVSTAGSGFHVYNVTGVVKVSVDVQGYFS